MFDLILVTVAGLSQLLSAILGFIGTDKLTRKKLQWRRAAFIVFLVIGAASIAWSAYRSNSVQDAIKEGVDKLVVRDNGAPGETKLFLRCDDAVMPKVMLPTGELFVFGPHASTVSSDMPSLRVAALTRRFQPVGSPVVWNSKPNSIDAGQKCQLFNYGSGSVFDVVLTFDVAAKKVVTQGAGKTSGEMIGSGKWIVNIPKIDPGAGEPFVFYFFNAFAQAFFDIDATAPSATFMKTNDGPRQSIKVISASHRPLFLNPPM
jgi:hypothetical protein